jgi:Protein of unknown function (DUF2795)
LDNQENNKDIRESLQKVSSSTTSYICKICGTTFDESNMLDSHIAESHHHPKRTVTLNDMVNSVFKGQMNFPKTKAEILKYIESNKDDPSINPQVLDTLRKLSDKRYESEAELSFELNQIK